MWWHGFFDDDALWLFGPTLDPERTEREVEGVVRMLRLADGASIADLGCGGGRHVVPLARRGFRVTGFEWSPPSLAQASSRCETVGVEAGLVRADLRALPARNEWFDAALSLYSTLGYESDAETATFLKEARRVLKPGGRVVVEVLSRDRAVRDFAARREWYEVDGRVVRVQRRLDLRTGEERATFFYDRGTGPREKEFRRRLFTPTELEALLVGAGFAKVGFHGDWDGAPLHLDSPHLIAVARA